MDMFQEVKVKNGDVMEGYIDGEIAGLMDERYLNVQPRAKMEDINRLVHTKCSSPWKYSYMHINNSGQ